MKSRFSPVLSHENLSTQEEAERHKLWSETMSSPVFESSWPKKRKILVSSDMMHDKTPDMQAREGVKHNDEVRAI